MLCSYDKNFTLIYILNVLLFSKCILLLLRHDDIAWFVLKGPLTTYIHTYIHTWKRHCACTKDSFMTRKLILI